MTFAWIHLISFLDNRCHTILTCCTLNANTNTHTKSGAEAAFFIFVHRQITLRKSALLLLTNVTHVEISPHSPHSQTSFLLHLLQLCQVFFSTPVTNLSCSRICEISASNHGRLVPANVTGCPKQS